MVIKKAISFGISNLTLFFFKGGKGGFGAMLRAQAKVKGKKITDFGACRDLSGRRLRHVNDEILLNKWKEAKEKGEEFDPYEVLFCFVLCCVVLLFCCHV